MSLRKISREIIEEIEAEELESKEDVESRKKQLCGKYSFQGLPKNSDILEFAGDDEERARKLLKTKPMRTIS
ncbi:MAG: tRNA uridine(34) 5-carboxymethylaminomethyl modification radical SAM/GNAT enzyme Elp3, partial [Candidatus Nanohaloarchaea archaeon]